MTTFNTQIPTRERLIFALDVPNLEEAQALISNLVIRWSSINWVWRYFCPAIIFNCWQNSKVRGKKYLLI